jgi:hypothetical protein
VRETERFKQIATSGVVGADSALKKPSTIYASDPLGFTKQSLGMALTFMGCRYCKVKDLSLIPLNLLDFDTRNNFSGL